MTEKRQIYGPQRSSAKTLNLLQNGQYCEIYYSLEEAFDQKKHKIKQIYIWNPTATGLIL